MADTAAPRLVITDALGRRIVAIDKPLFSMGRRSETDGEGVSLNVRPIGLDSRDEIGVVARAEGVRRNGKERVWCVTR